MFDAGQVHAGKIYSSHAFGSQLGTIDLVTGTGTDIGPYELGMFQTQSAFDTDGGLYTFSVLDFPDNTQTQLATVDTTTGAATAVGPSMEGLVSALEIDSSNMGYGIQYIDDTLGFAGVPTFYRIDITNAQLTAVGNSEVERAMDTAIDSNGRLWVVGGANGGNRLYTIDPMTGASELETAVTGVAEATGVEDAEIMGIMFNEKDVLYGTAFVENSPLFTIDTSTGAVTVVGNTGFLNPHGGDYLVPEPSTLIMLSGLAAVVGIAISGRRRRNVV
jgi:hypothetical protein